MVKLDSHADFDASLPPGAEAEHLARLWRRYWQERDRTSRDNLILAYERVVATVLSRLPAALRAHWDIEDLHSFGLLGLVEAIDRFEANSEPRRFAAYAMARIRGAIFDELRRLDWLPRSVRRRVISYRNALEDLAGELGRTPATEEVLTVMGVSKEESGEVLKAVQSAQLVYLEQGTRIDANRETAPIMEVLAACEEVGPEDSAIVRDRVEQVRRAIKQLPERQRTVVSLRFFAGMTQGEIGSMLGVSNSRVCQIEAGALSQLRWMLNDDCDGVKRLRAS